MSSPALPSAAGAPATTDPTCRDAATSSNTTSDLVGLITKAVVEATKKSEEKAEQRHKDMQALIESQAHRIDVLQYAIKGKDSNENNPNNPTRLQLQRRRQEAEEAATRAARQAFIQNFVNSGLPKSEAELRANAIFSPKLDSPLKGLGLGTLILPSAAQPAVLPTSSSAASSARGRITLKVDDVGTFNGDVTKVHRFTSRIQSLIESRKRDSEFEQAVLDLLPLCMRNSADEWYYALPIETRNAMTDSWAVFKRNLLSDFAADLTKTMEDADARRWNPDVETADAYHLNKLSKLRAAYPERSERELCMAIIRGLPGSFQSKLRTQMMSKPSLHLIGKLRQYKSSWRAEQEEISVKIRQLRRTTGASPSSTVRPLPPHLAAPSPSRESATRDPAPRESTPFRKETPVNPRASLSQSYNPDNVSYVEKDGRRVRAYRIPATGSLVYLKHPCRRCEADHFDFEHEYKSAFKAETHFHDGEWYFGDWPLLDADIIELSDTLYEASTGTISSRQSMEQSPDPLRGGL